MSPSRSLSSASPPTLNGMIQGASSGGAATPTPEENPEYLKELQLEKDNLEAALMASNDNSAAASGEQLNEANGEAPNNATVKTNHALKLLEQGKATLEKTISNQSLLHWESIEMETTAVCV